MNMTEALDWAAQYAKDNKLFEPDLNARGYVKDGWIAPSAETKLKVIKELAMTVYQAPRLEDIATLCPHGAMICAPCDHIPPQWRSFPLTV